MLHKPTFKNSKN